jgi:Zn finger protein HypA/HybF involved in hydrogenase expression
MGKRGWTFMCQDCGCSFGEFFDHVDFSQLDNRLNNISCTECQSNKWKITDKTSFSGGPEESVSDVGVNCKNCYDDFFIPISGKTKNELIKMKENIECQSCEDGKLEIGDRVR